MNTKRSTGGHPLSVADDLDFHGIDRCGFVKVVLGVPFGMAGRVLATMEQPHLDNNTRRVATAR